MAFDPHHLMHLFHFVKFVAEESKKAIDEYRWEQARKRVEEADQAATRESAEATLKAILAESGLTSAWQPQYFSKGVSSAAWKVQCRASLANGRRCPNEMEFGLSSAYCDAHTPNGVCHAMTQAGAQCRSATNGVYCRRHDPGYWWWGQTRLGGRPKPVAKRTVSLRADRLWHVSGERRPFRTKREAIHAARTALVGLGGGRLIVVDQDGRTTTQTKVRGSAD